MEEKTEEQHEGAHRWVGLIGMMKAHVQQQQQQQHLGSQLP